MSPDGRSDTLILDGVLAPRFPVRAKVRCGIKDGKRPKAVEWFVSTDPAFDALGDRPNPIEIVLPYAEARSCFTVSLEQWRGKVLACFSDDGRVAKRKAGRDGWTLQPGVDGRTDVSCPRTECEDYLAGNCKPTGRLYFFLAADADRNAVFQLDTHGQKTIQQFRAVLDLAGADGSLAGRRALLHVAMVRVGRKDFPVQRLELLGGAGVTIPQDQAPLDEADREPPPDAGEEWQAAAEDAGAEPLTAPEHEELEQLLAQRGKAVADPAVQVWLEQVGERVALERLRARS